jgi:hypothetical protein
MHKTTRKQEGILQPSAVHFLYFTTFTLYLVKAGIRFYLYTPSYCAVLCVVLREALKLAVAVLNAVPFQRALPETL